MQKYLVTSLISAGIVASFILYDKFVSNSAADQASWKVVSGRVENAEAPAPIPEKPPKTKEELLAEALERSDNAKGVYMTAAVANDQGRPATHLRSTILDLVDTTELNAIVIDVKEVGGAEVTSHLKPFIDELKQKGTWTIARITTFRDDSQKASHPEYYLKRVDNGGIWKDNRGGTWLDPGGQAARTYIVDFAKSIIDIGFDELQFDYIRFPSDGNIKNIVFDTKVPKYVTLKSFFEYLNINLKEYKFDIILSADLFGYVATNNNDLGIGQRIEDIGSNFDYISFMVYPSHYYSGFQMPADLGRKLPALYLPYRGKDITALVSSHPYDVIYRSMLYAGDVLAGRVAIGDMASVGKPATTTGQLGANATSTAQPEPVRLSNSRLRPWLQDFNLGADTSRGIYYDVKKVRAQIDAAEDAGTSGWILWNASNVYTSEALKKE